MTEDIWKEIPTSNAVGTMSDMFLRVYHKESIDGFHKKLKTHYELIEEKAEKFDMVNQRDVAEATRRYALFMTMENKVERMSKKLEAIKTLVIEWGKDIKEYPDTPEGQYAWAAVKLCSDELKEILEVTR